MRINTMNTIKSHFIKTCILCLSAGLLSIVSFSAAAGSVADATSKHNMSGTGGGQNFGATSTEVCVYCHTPHGADTSASVPLWNKKLPSGAGYTRYISSTIDGANGDLATAPSLACLSCHDGTQAMDSVINRPGSGLYDANGVRMGGIGTGFMAGDVSAPGLGGTIPNLTQDLSDDHPVSIEYAGGGTCDSTVAADCTTANFTDKDFNTAQYDTVNGSAIWWVDETTAAGNTTNVRDKTDMFLYTRTIVANNVNPAPYVECGSCHDPHNVDSALIADTVQFLRVANEDSVVCTTCHNK